MPRSRQLRRLVPLHRTWRSVVVVLAIVGAVATVSQIQPASAANSVSLTRYPYVTDVVGNSARINWGTDTSQSTGSVTWGAVSGGTCTPTTTVAATKVSITVGKSEYQWTAPITFPSSGTYCYRVQLGSTDLLGTDPSPQVTTAAAPGSSYSFAVLGDWGQATTGEANVMSQIGKSPAQFVVTTGDNVYNSGTDAEYGDLSQGNVFPKQYLPALGSRPIFASEGNHGFTQNLPYLQNFPGLTAAQASGGRFARESYCCISTLPSATNYPSAWYAFDWGSARYYVLDGAWADGTGGYQGDFLAHWNGSVSGCGPCGAELTWLKSDLASHASTPIKFAFFHYPLHSDSSGQPSDTYLDGPNGLEGLLANNNVDIVFNGHAHRYERNYPQIAGKPMVTYVTGTGGAALDGGGGCSSFDAYSIGSGGACNTATVPNANVYGFLLVTVNGNKVTVTPTDSTGRTFDVQTYTIPGATPTNDFSLAASPASASVTAGSAATSTINTAVTSGVAQSVALTASGLPTGATASFIPSSVTSGSSSALSITTAPGTTPGPYTVTITGAGTSATHTTTFALTVTGPPPTNDFSLAASPASASVTAGSAATSTINTAVTSGVAQSVALTASGLPTGATASFIPSSVTSGSSSALSITTAPGTTPGPYTVTITGTGTSATHTTTFALTVTGPPPTNDFSLAASPASASVTAGSAATSTINTAVTSGVAQSVALTASGLPTGALVSFNSSPVTAGSSSALSITTAPGTTPGPYTVTITGTGTSATHTTTFALTVDAPTGTAPQLVESASGTETASSTTLNGSFPVPTTAGHLLVLSASVYTGATNPITSVTDSAGNTWTRIGTAHFVAGHYSDGEMWYSANAKPVTTVTIHNASAVSASFEAQEFSGVATTNPLDVSAGTSNTGTAANSGSITTTAANELVVGFVAGHNNAQAIAVTSPGYAIQPQQTTTGTNIATVVTGVRVLATPGAQSFAGSFGSAMYWASDIATFKPGS